MLTEDDWDDYLALHRDADVMRFVGARTDDAFIRRRFDRIVAEYRIGLGHWAVIERGARNLLGAVGLLSHADWTATPYNTEVGWLIGRAHWGRGYATEAGEASTASRSTTSGSSG